MEIFFKSRKLEKVASNPRKCQKEFGERRAELFLRRLQQLYRAINLEDVRNLPGNYHELSGNRKGQWACDLDQPGLSLNHTKGPYLQTRMENIFG